MPLIKFMQTNGVWCIVMNIFGVNFQVEAFDAAYSPVENVHVNRFYCIAFEKRISS